MRTFLSLLLTGCLVGTDHLKGIPNTPTLDGEVVLLTPEPGPDGAFAREGDTVEIGFSTLAAIDPEASIVTLDGFPMAFAGNDGFTYRYQRTLDGSEGSSPKTVTGTLRNAAERQGALGSPVLLETDFIPPTGSCVLNPRSANANDAITFVVTPSEPLREPPSITPSASELSVTFREQVEGQFFYDLEGEPDTNLDGYVLTVEAFDRAGNPQRGDSLCEVEDRTGTLLGRGPALDGDVILTAAPSVEVGGVPWVREGAVLTVSIPTAEPIDAEASSVALSGLDLAPVADTPNTWTLTLDGTEGDGFKNLDAVLFDAAGNTLRVQRPAITRFDFTPPTATCSVSPNPANGQQAVTFALAPDEPLAGPPTLASAQVSLGPPTLDGTRWTATVTAPPNADTPFTLDATATDRVGNTASGDDLCPEADRTGRVFGVDPALSGEPTLTVLSGPQVPDDDATRVGLGAVVEVRFETVAPLDRAATSVQLGDLPLAWDDPSSSWRRTIQVGDPDGRKALTLSLVDPAGNRAVVQRSGLAVRVDLTPPDLASAVLTRTPFFATADDGSGTVLFTTTDPLTGQAVSASLRVTATEDLGVSPILDVHGPASLTWAPAAGAARLANWSLPTIPEGQDGTYTFAVTLEDGLGNRSAPIPLEAVMEIDTVAPANPPNVAAPDRIVLEREPWGTTSVGGTPRYRVVGGIATAPRGVLVSVENAFGAVLGTTTSGGDGSFEIGIGADLADAFVRTHDRAGNPSPTGRVRDVAWTATMAGKVEGSSRENPHGFVSAGATGGGLAIIEQNDIGERAVLPEYTFGAPPWLPWGGNGATGEKPSARSHHAIVYDAARGVTVLVGGIGTSSGACGTATSTYCSDTWEWDGATWTQRTPATSPPARSSHALAYDAARGVTVLFGGFGTAPGTCGTTGSGRCSDTWEWDGTTWTEVTPTASPPARDAHVLAYDVARGVTVLFGGFGTATGACGTTDRLECSDTWEWDGKTWTEVTPSTSPPGRFGHALAYDAARGVTVLFGGSASSGTCGTTGGRRCSGTWEWDGSSWTERTPATSPPARDVHALAYDVARGVTVLFGGSASSGACGTTGSGQCFDTWEWDGASWTQRMPATSPPARVRHGLAYDAARGVAVLFGGSASSGTCGTPDSQRCSDTWEWDGSTWTEVTSAAAPPARNRHALAYDAARGVTVLFGGFGTGPGTCGTPDSQRCSDTWEWDGSNWTEVTSAATPSAREDHALAYDATRGVTVLFGGFGTGPGTCGSQDSQVCSDTWEWDGANWTQRTPSTRPPARTSHTLAYDAARGVTVLFGGDGDAIDACGTTSTSSCSDTWEWNGATWRQRATTCSEDTTYDVNCNTGSVPDCKGDCYPGSWIGDDTCDDGTLQPWGTPNFNCATHDFDGGDCPTDTEICPLGQTPATSPPARTDHALAYDVSRGVTVLFGGSGTAPGACGMFGSARCSDTWEWDGATWIQRTPATSPPTRYAHALAHDTARGTAVLFGGWGLWSGVCGTPSSDRCSDTWEWDGTTWTQRTPAISPPARYGHALAYDAARGTAVVFGGRGISSGACGALGTDRCSDTWLLHPDSSLSPRHTFTAAFAPALAPGATLRTVTARWTAGGSGTPGGDPTEGAELLVWNGLGWTVLGAHASGPDAPAPLCTRIVADPTAPPEPGCADLLDPGLLQGLFRFGPDLTSTFAVRPTAPIGTDEGELRSEDVAVTVRYRLPGE